ncbi:hypothetical protein HK100_010055 [Physocladia obscura]|uniref:Uncharacterized protein n=1 Tax=Physocladia obscura TaxID=109957 RepID=A0AAD5T3C8_9FUNG|nr:hypothetical protein HK100_010055 [Physocladia obscura]
MAVLKKTGTPSASKRFKPAAIITPQISVKSQSGRTSRGSSLLNEDEALIRSLRLGVIISPDTEDAPMSIRSKFKKQMIEKELSTTVTFRIAELELNVMKSARERLFGEQRELLSERERCVAADAEVNGIWDTQKPQYMDDRLSVIDMEVAMLNAKIRNLEDEFRLGRAASVMRNHYSENRLDSFPELEIDMPQGDAGWENAVNLLRSLDVIEQEYVAVLFLQDVVDNKINVRSLETKIADQEKVIFDLRSSLSTMRGAALQTAMEYRKEMDNMRKIAEEKIASVSEEISQTLTRPKISSRRREGLGGLSRSRSSLFSYDEFGAATPKLQKMFDSAYGHGFVVLKPSIRVLSGEMQATDIERVLGGVEKALKQEVKSPIVPEDTIDSSFASDYDGSPVRKRASSFNFDGINESSTMRRYNLRPRSRRISGGDQNQNPNESIESIATPFASTVLQPSIDNGIDGFETMAIERGRTETRVISSPPRVVRASSMPESPVAADSNKAVIRDFININLKRRKRAKIADISTEHTIADLEKEIQQINSTSNSSETKLVPGITKSWSQRSNISSFRADSSFESEADVSVTIRRKQSRATLEGIDGSGADVFARLATSHTLASQAKVIHREKDADAIGSAGLSSSVKNMRDNQR